MARTTTMADVVPFATDTSSACVSGVTGVVPVGFRPDPRGSDVTTGRSVNRAASDPKPRASIGETDITSTGRSAVACVRSPRTSTVNVSSPAPTVDVVTDVAEPVALVVVMSS